MGLTVLNVAYPFAPVGPDAVGGAEQVLSAIDGALVAAGHHSLLIACEGSRAKGTLIPTRQWSERVDAFTRAQAHQEHRAAIAHALETFRVDLVHLHGIDFHHYLPPGAVPTLVSVHLPPTWYPEFALKPTRPSTFLNAVSRSQLTAMPKSAALLGAIPNGVPLEVFRPSHHRGSFALALGRICPEKGFHLALEAAERAEVPLVLGGQVFPYPQHERYFHEAIAPHLGPTRRFLGPLGLARKRRLLAAARCLLVTSQVPETSSLVAMEALASGTPVIAFAVGALPEIVEHGRTGFLVRDVGELAEAMKEVDRIDRAECRRAALERFSEERMTRQYLTVYERMAERFAAVEARP